MTLDAVEVPVKGNTEEPANDNREQQQRVLVSEEEDLDYTNSNSNRFAGTLAVNSVTMKQEQQIRRVMIAANEEDDDDDNGADIDVVMEDQEYVMPVKSSETKFLDSLVSGSGAPSRSSSRRSSAEASNPPSSRQSSFKLPTRRESFGEPSDILSHMSTVASSDNINLSNSQGSKSVTLKVNPIQRVRCTSNSLDETAHQELKGRGFLASKRDLGLDLDTFAEGCKFLALVARGDLDAVKLWVQDSPDFTQFRDYDRRTALHVAASEGHLNIVIFLIEYLEKSNYSKKRTINRSDRWGGSPLDDAHRHRHKEVAHFLRIHGAKTGTFDDHVSEFLVAASKGDVDIIRELIGIGVDFDAGDYDDRTAMHLAAGGDHANVIKVLLDAGADANVIDRWGGRPLDDAKRHNASRAMGILLEHNAILGSNHDAVHGAPIDLSEHMGHKLDHDNLRIEFTELEILDRIGGGAFGEILKCRWRGTLVAAKCIKSAKIYKDWMTKHKQVENFEDMSLTTKEQAIEDFRMEIDILKQIRHPNICMLLAYSTTSDFEVMVSELARCSLEDIFKANFINNRQLAKRTQIVYAQQLAQGMNYLHTCKPPIIHRDLKPANLLIDYSGALQIADFGLAKIRPKPSQSETDTYTPTGETGSYRFMAPEVYRHENYTETVDVYSYSMIFYYILSGHQPWPTLPGITAAHTAAMEGSRPNIPRDWDERITQLLKMCWDETPSARPQFSHILMNLNRYSQQVFKTEENEVAHHVENTKCGCIIS